MSSLISSNYPDTPWCPRLGRIMGQFREQAYRQPETDNNCTLTNVTKGPVAANKIMEGSIMLVLSRKVGESILISESIRVTVVQSNNGRIRLGIDAPPEIKVLREETPPLKNNTTPDQVLLQLAAKQERQSGSTVSFRPAALPEHTGAARFACADIPRPHCQGPATE